MSNQNTPNRLSTPSGFSFGKLLTPKLRQIINFDSQPVQAGSPEVKKSGLEAYAKKNKLSLPADFSDLVLECEMELEKEEVSLDTITRLTDLYSQAMAYYEAEGSHKYKYFAKKLQDLMLKPNVKETMVREIAPAKTGEQDKELKRMRLESQISKVNTEKEAFTLVKTHEHKEKEIKRVLQGDLTSQRDRIQKKLAQRKAKSQSRAQSVTYISDDASSTTEEVQGDGDKDASPKAENKLIKIEEADEADESRYGTPPRRRNKDGQMIIYFPKGNKSLKRLFLDELKKENEEVKKARGHVRRNSENKAPVLGGVTPGANKRTARAQSFTARNLVYPGLDRLRHTTSFEKEENKVESKEQQEVKSAVDIVQKEEHVESAAVIMNHEEEKPKSNNIVEEADEEGSKNGSASNSKSNVEQEEVAVTEKADEVSQEGPAQEVVEEKHVAAGGSVVINDEAHVEEKEEVVVETLVHNSEEKKPEAPAQVEEEVRQEIAQEEKEAEPVEEQEVKEEQVEAEPVKENKEEEIKQEAVEEEKEPEVPVQVEEEVRQEVAQEEKEAEQEVAVEQQENKEEVVAEAEVEVVQENNEVKAEIVNEVQEEVNKEEEQREPENVVAAVEETNTEKVEEVNVEENNAPEVQQVEVAEVEQKEEIKTETENISQEQVAPEVQEEKEEKVEESAPVVANRRTRTDSEIADEEKLKMMRKIDEEHKLLLEELVNKQTVAKEEATKQVEEKFQKKLQAMEEDMDEDEKLSMMWQKAIAKINKDKETELQKVLEALAQEQTQEVEKYKKKLQQQKMFKLAELDS